MNDTENVQNLINERNNQNKRIEQLVLEIERLNNTLKDLQQKVEVKNERIKEEQQEKERYIKFYNGLNIWNKDLQQKVEQQDKEIDRLNSIINKLEKWCLSWKKNDKYCYLASNDKDKCRYDIWEEVLDKLKELKENK